METTHSLIIIGTAITAALILVQSTAFAIAFVKMHRDLTGVMERMETRFLEAMTKIAESLARIEESIERMEKYRLVERK